MEKEIPSIFDDPMTSFADVVLPESDLGLQEMHNKLLDDVRESNEKHRLSLLWFPRSVNNLPSLKQFIDTALKIFLDELVLFRETTITTLQDLENLKKEVSRVLNSVVKRIHNVTPRGTMPPAKRFSLFPFIRGAEQLILQKVSEQISILTIQDQTVQAHMPILQHSVQKSFRDAYEKIEQALSQPGRDGDDAKVIRDIYYPMTVNMLNTEDMNKSLLFYMVRHLNGEKFSADGVIITARKMIHTARNTAASCFALLGASQAPRVMQAVNDAMCFTKQPNLIKAKYQMIKAVNRLYRTYDMLDSMNPYY